jgi:hypothetical protein
MRARVTYATTPIQGVEHQVCCNSIRSGRGSTKLQLLPTLKEVERIAYEQIGASMEEEEQLVSFMLQGEDICYHRSSTIEEWEFEPDAVDFPFLDWSSGRIAALRSEDDQPTAEELQAWRETVARDRLQRGDDYSSQALIVPIKVMGEICGYVVVDCGVMDSICTDPIVEGTFRTEDEAWKFLQTFGVLERDGPR